MPRLFKLNIFCSGLDLLESGKWFLALSVVLRFTAGIGSAMFTVSATSILLKGTDYSSTNIVVSVRMHIKE